MDVRPAVDEDLPAIAKIALANDEQDAGADPRYVTHLGSAGRFLVAELDGGLAGYCATREVDGVTMLCDLFVDPARHGGGVGGRLLDAVFEGAGERFTFASRDPRAMSPRMVMTRPPHWSPPSAPSTPAAYASACPAPIPPCRSCWTPGGGSRTPTSTCPAARIS